MMNDVSITYSDFWGQFVDPFGLPGIRQPGQITAFVEGLRGVSARDDPPYPHITYPEILPSFAQNMTANASIWDRVPSMPGFRGLVNSVASQVQEQMRPSGEGVSLWVADVGVIRLFYTGMQVMGDPNDHAIVRMLINFTVRGLVA